MERIGGKDRRSAQQSSTGCQIKQEICRARWQEGRGSRSSNKCENPLVSGQGEQTSSQEERRRIAEISPGGLDRISPPGLVKRASTAGPGVAFLNSLTYWGRSNPREGRFLATLWTDGKCSYSEYGSLKKWKKLVFSGYINHIHYKNIKQFQAHSF